MCIGVYIVLCGEKDLYQYQERCIIIFSTREFVPGIKRKLQSKDIEHISKTFNWKMDGIFRVYYNNKFVVFYYWRSREVSDFFNGKQLRLKSIAMLRKTND